MKKYFGYSMVELMIVLAISAVAGMSATMLWNAHTKEQAFQKDGAHMNIVRKAVNDFTATSYSIITNARPIAEVRKMVLEGKYPAWKREVPRIGTGAAPADQDSYRYSKNVADVTTTPGTDIFNDCPDDHQCVEITMQNLRNWGYLTATFPDKSPSGYEYRIIIREYQNGGTLSPALAAVIATTKPITNPYKASPLAGVAGREDDAFDDTAAYHFSGVMGAHAGVVRTVPASKLARLSPELGINLLPADQLTAGDIAALGPGDPFGWFVKAGRWPNITTPGQVAAAAGWWGKDRDEFLCVDGCNSMTNHLDMGGYALKNLMKVIPNGPCDGTDATSALSKSMGGYLGTLDSTTTGGAGEGFTLTCQPATSGSNSYIWQKSTTGPQVVDDIPSGIYDSTESHSGDLCFGNLAAPSLYGDNEVPVKFVIGRETPGGPNGRIGLYWFDASAGVWKLTFSGPISSVKIPVQAYFKVYSEVNRKSYCSYGGQDPFSAAPQPLNGISGSAWITFSPTLVTYKSTGDFARSVSGTGQANPNLGVVQNMGGLEP